jgi:hypothetical protein
MSYSVLRRYTPPTCTLEILAKSSPLSRWAGQPVLKNLRFRLSLDDPTLPKEDWVVFQGDRAQLDALCDAVAEYVQHFLEQSHDLLETTFALSPSDSVIPWNEYSGKEALTSPTVDRVKNTPSLNPTSIRIQPRGLLAHDLLLGSLATEESGPVVHLTTLQLFDLANALDDYSSDVISLPNLGRSSGITGSPAWLQISAVALVVVGLSTSVLKLMDGSLTTSKPTAAPTTSQGASSSDQRIATQLPPSITEKPIPPVSSNQQLPSPPPPTASTPARPGLPTVTLPQAAPVNPSNPPTGNGAPPPPAESPVVVSAAPRVTAEQRTQPPQPSLPKARFESEFSQDSSYDQASGATEAQPLARGAAPAQADANSTAFDTLPQVAEARLYFQGRWTPPEGLTQTLEYRLLINPDGTIQRIIPLGQAAGDYVDRSGIPLVGEPLVSPIAAGRSIKIRLVLSPDGKVQTFLE